MPVGVVDYCVAFDACHLSVDPIAVCAVDGGRRCGAHGGKRRRSSTGMFPWPPEEIDATDIKGMIIVPIDSTPHANRSPLPRTEAGTLPTTHH